jgi:hypothetical protein
MNSVVRKGEIYYSLFSFRVFSRVNDACPTGGYKSEDWEQIKAQREVAWDLIKQMGQNLTNGRSIINVTMPARIFEPRSYLQRIADGWCYAPIYLTQAANILLDFILLPFPIPLPPMIASYCSLTTLSTDPRSLGQNEACDHLCYFWPLQHLYSKETIQSHSWLVERTNERKKAGKVLIVLFLALPI